MKLLRAIALLVLSVLCILGQTNTLAPAVHQQFFDANGYPLAGGLLYTYAAGTSSPLATYQSAGGAANTNPIVLSPSGFANIWLQPGVAYKFVATDTLGVTLWTVDGVVNARTFIFVQATDPGCAAASDVGKLWYNGAATTVFQACVASANTYGWAQVSTVSTSGQVFNGAVTITSGGLAVTGPTTLAGNLNVTGNASISGLLTAAGGFSTSALQVSAGAADPGCVLVSDLGKVWFNNATNTTLFNSCVAKAGVIGWSQLNNLGTGPQTFNGLVTITSGGLAVTGPTTLNGPLNVTGVITASGGLATRVNGISYGHSSSTTCPTGTGSGATCTFTVNWTNAFPDANYAASCTIISPSGSPSIQGIVTKSTVGVVVQVQNGTSNMAVASGGASMDCVAIEN